MAIVKGAKYGVTRKVTCGKVEASLGYHEGSSVPVVDVKIDGVFLARKGLKFWAGILALATGPDLADLERALYGDDGIIAEENKAANAKAAEQGKAILLTWETLSKVPGLDDKAKMKMLLAQYPEAEIKAAFEAAKAEQLTA